MTNLLKLMSQSTRFKQGFTLIELALVILLISISLLLIAPAVSTLVSSYKQDSALLRIETFLNYHQAEVERSGKKRKTVMDLEKGEYWAETEENSNFSEITEVLGKRTALPGSLSFVSLLTSEGEFSEGKGGFFLSSFVIEPVIIHLKDKEEKEYSLYWKPLSGKMEIYDGYIEAQ